MRYTLTDHPTGKGKLQHKSSSADVQRQEFYGDCFQIGQVSDRTRYTKCLPHPSVTNISSMQNRIGLIQLATSIFRPQKQLQFSLTIQARHKRIAESWSCQVMVLHLSLGPSCRCYPDPGLRQCRRHSKANEHQ